MSSGGGGETTTKNKIPPHLAGIMQNNIVKARQALGQSFIGPEGLVAGSNENIDAGQQAALGAAGYQDQLAAQGRSLFGELGQFGSQQDPILQRRLEQIANMGTRNLQENILPGIRTGSVQAGQAGSSRQGIAEGIAARGASEAVTNAQTDLLGQAQAQRLQALQAAQGYLPSLQQAQAAGAQTIGAVGAQQRDIENQVRQSQLQRQQAELQRLAGLNNITQQNIAPFITTTSSTDSGGSQLGSLAGAAGGFLLGGPAGAGIGAQLGGMLG